MMNIRRKCETLDKIMTCHKGCGMDGACHHNCPKMEQLWHMEDHKTLFLEKTVQHMLAKASDATEFEEQHEEEHAHQHDWNVHERLSRAGFHERMKQDMAKVKQCHLKCGMDTECHMKCPKPWEKLQERCEKISLHVSCHENCVATQGGKACHMKCPKPPMQCPKMAAQVSAARACHMECKEGDLSCHNNCPKPMMKIRRKCEALDSIMTCHRGCGMDGACHHKCPKMEQLWHMEDAKTTFARAIQRMLPKGGDVTEAPLHI